MDKKSNDSKYFDGNKFFILHHFNEQLRDGIVIPLTREIEKQSKLRNGQIDIYINSRGGDGMLCWYIVRLIEMAKARGIIVRTIVMETAYSAGSIVACAGSPGHRYISKTAEHCVHYGSQPGWTEYTPLQIERNALEKQRWFKKVLVPGSLAIKYKLADHYLEAMK